jgi:hypothetical protein
MKPKNIESQCGYLIFSFDEKPQIGQLVGDLVAVFGELVSDEGIEAKHKDADKPATIDPLDRSERVHDFSQPERYTIESGRGLYAIIFPTGNKVAVQFSGDNKKHVDACMEAMKKRYENGN